MVFPSRKYALLPLAICLASTSTYAATNADLERRLVEQEKKIKKLERKLTGTRGAVKQNRNRISDISDRFKVNGFFSGGLAVNDGDDAELAIYDIGDNFSAQAVSRLGIQMTFKVADDMNLTGQLVSRGVNDYELEAEWAYLSWDVSNDFTLRIGRQRTPYYLLSEYLEVGYAYPWVRPPIELYNIPISSNDGVSLLYDFSVGDWNFSTQGYFGSSKGFADQLEGEFKLNQGWGVAAFAENGPWTFRMGFNTSNLDVESRVDGGIGDQLLDGVEGMQAGLAQFAPFAEQLAAAGSPVPTIKALPLENIETQYISAAASYDDGSLLVIGEIAHLRVVDFVQPAGDGGYLTVGYRFGKWMPHFTYGKFYTDAKNDAQVQEYLDAAAYVYALTSGVGGDPNEVALHYGAQALYNNLSMLVQQQTSYTLGLTYDINNRVKAKFEVALYEEFGKVNQIAGEGETVSLPPGISVNSIDYTQVDGNGRFTGAPGATGGSTAIYSFSIDAVF